MFKNIVFYGFVLLSVVKRDLKVDDRIVPPTKIISFWTTTSGVEMLTQEGVAGYLKDHM